MRTNSQYKKHNCFFLLPLDDASNVIMLYISILLSGKKSNKQLKAQLTTG